MKLERIDVERYGVLHNVTLQFVPGLQLIYGPNEAGKSTLLQLIRQALFGFPHQSPYSSVRFPGEQAITAGIRLDNGRGLRFRRRKGRSQSVVGHTEPDGDAVDQARLRKLMDGATEELYHHIFAFSLGELSTGQESLKSANLRDALYGGGWGGLTRFRAAQTRIATFRKELFSPKAHKPTINRLLLEIKEKRQALAAAAVRPKDYQLLLQEEASYKAHVSVCHQSLTQLNQEIENIDAILRTCPLWRQITELQRELADLRIPETFPADGEQEILRSRQNLTTLEQELREIEDEKTRCEQELTQLTLDPQILAHTDEVKRLHQQLGKMASLRANLPRLQNELASSQTTLSAQLHSLEAVLPPTDLRQLPLGHVAREALLQLHQQQEAAERRLAELLAQQSTIKQGIERIEGELANGPPPDESLNQFASILSQQGNWQGQAAKMEQMRQVEKRLQVELQQLEERLNLLVDRPVAHWAPLVPPAEHVIREHHVKLDEATRRLQHAQQEQDRTHRLWDQKKAELRELSQGGAIPDGASLAQARRQRDAFWRRICDRFAAGNNKKSVRQSGRAGKSADVASQQFTSAEKESWVETFDRLVAEADRLADHRYEASDLVARYETLSQDCQTAESQALRAASASQARQTELAAVQEEWLALWATCGVAPREPIAMLDLQRMHAEYVDKLAQLQAMATQIQAISSDLDRFSAAVRAAWPENTAPIGETMEAMRSRLELARQKQAQHTTWNAELSNKQHQAQSLRTEVIHQRRRCQDLQRDWQRCLKRFGLPTDWTGGVALRMLSELETARQMEVNVRTQRTQLQECHRQVEEFEAAVHPLLKSITEDQLGLTSEEGVKYLYRRLEDAQAQQMRGESLKVQLTSVVKRAEQKQRQWANLLQRRDELMAAAGVTDDQELMRIAGAASRRAQLQRDIERLRGQLDIIRGDRECAPFESNLSAANPLKLQTQLSRLRDQNLAADEDYRQAVRQHGIAQHRLQQWDGESVSAQLAVELESLRSQLAAAVDRWAPLVLCESLMREAIQRFERESQPALLQEANRLFTHLTRGRYVRIHRRLDEEGTMLVEEADGHQKTPDQLSTGTREQLYLAIRLAYIDQYCQRAESLPIVLDDVLVNFDDDRKGNTFELLKQLAQSLQIVFLTCHQSVVEVAQARLGEVHVIELPRAPSDVPTGDPQALVAGS